jgi:cell division protein ZipA
MQANWSLILNVLLLIGVITAIGRLMKTRKQSIRSDRYQPVLGKVENSPYDTRPFNDDIIAVRKVNSDDPVSIEPEVAHQEAPKLAPKPAQPQLIPQAELYEEIKEVEIRKVAPKDPPATLMMFLLAKENRQFAGYELLQTVLAAGLRFGEGHLFHRHQFANGQGPILCSLAAATATGVFDLQNIGAFSVRGLCLFMQASKNPSIDAERFSIMLETARQLSEGMDAHLLDDQRKPLNAERMARYYRALNLPQEEDEYVTA